VDTHSFIILSFKVTSAFKADGRQVRELLHLIYHLTRICADKAYLSRKVCDFIVKHHAKPYIPLKKSILKIRGKGSRAWKEMILLYRRGKKIFLKRYHRRSLAETAISTVKRRFDHTLTSTKRKTQKNELRLKVITYNLTIIARTKIKA